MATDSSADGLSIILKSLQRFHPPISELLANVGQVWFFDLNEETGEWSKLEIEGSFYLFLSNKNELGFTIMNRIGMDNYVEYIKPQMELEFIDTFLTYRNQEGNIRGLYFPSQGELEDIKNIVAEYMEKAETSASSTAPEVAAAAVKNTPSPSSTATVSVTTPAMPATPTASTPNIMTLLQRSSQKSLNYSPPVHFIPINHPIPIQNRVPLPHQLPFHPPQPMASLPSSGPQLMAALFNKPIATTITDSAPNPSSTLAPTSQSPSLPAPAMTESAKNLHDLLQKANTEHKQKQQQQQQSQPPHLQQMKQASESKSVPAPKKEAPAKKEPQQQKPKNGDTSISPKKTDDGKEKTAAQLPTGNFVQIIKEETVLKNGHPDKITAVKSLSKEEFRQKLLRGLETNDDFVTALYTAVMENVDDIVNTA